MLNNLDTVKSEMASQTLLKVAAGSATVVSFGASAAYFIWLLRGGSLLSSLLSIFPAWKSMDPLPVLDSFENSRKRKSAAPPAKRNRWSRWSIARTRVPKTSTGSTMGTPPETARKMP